MNISDLNYLEAVEVKVVGGRRRGGGTKVNKDINLDVNFDLDINADIKFYKDFNANIKIDSDVDVKGNSTTVLFDAEAIGEDTVVEVDVVVLTTDGLSSASGSIISAVG
ncbi:MAG TPA: hypothetical protein IGS31_03560 [Oscillatoriales cyanobacterium M4454_W2019_049]|nr:hypothetical protein [Oscillatoriales cyanobacterium M4454_W2019_049]